ncbi:hypothetical protein B0H13DRAFT_2578790 [Mycena leptocephala]|nr:hypothetical protein B0H13DRAFT_2578790 [Mycena leptocephala]
MFVTTRADPIALGDVPLSLVATDPAGEVEILRYVWVGTAAVFIWDVLNNAEAEYRLLFKHKVRREVVTYFTSRILCLAYVIGSLIFFTNPVGSCRTLNRALDALYSVALPSTSLLFFFRVRTIYGKARTATGVFGLLWVAELAACIVVPFGTAGINIGPTPYCFIAELAPYIAVAPITRIIFDTAVFVATSYRLIDNNYIDYFWRAKFRVFLTGGSLPSFSRSLLADGQMYYIVTVFSNIAMASLILAPGLSPMYRNLVTLPNLVLTSVMACRVYRHTRLVLTQEPHGISCSNALGNIGDTHSKAQSPDCVCPARQRGDDPCDKAATVMHLERSQKEVTDRYSTNEGLV